MKKQENVTHDRGQERKLPQKTDPEREIISQTLK